MAKAKKITRTRKKFNTSELFYNGMIMPGIIMIVLFNFVPMFGIVMAFQDYKPTKGFLGSAFVGFKHFKYLFQIPDGYQIFRNTLVIATGKIIIGTVVAIIFAILLNEIRVAKLKKTVQTIVYLPHFLSWVVLAAAIKSIFGLDGIVNSFLGTELNFLGSNQLFQGLLIGSDVWKEFGYNSVVFLAALTSIDPGLYEAAEIDGANWWQRTFHVTLPGMRSVIFLMTVMGLGNILNAGFDQVYNLYSASVYETGDIIDTYVYRVGLYSMQYSFGTAIGLMKSVIAFILMMTANGLAKRFSDSKIF
ncbi:MAG: sugar ABC transporter permease [Clostridiales bacterium]|nr:sugar ABC transporter permease [Clostridiales bacterium]